MINSLILTSCICLVISLSSLLGAARIIIEKEDAIDDLEAMLRTQYIERMSDSYKNIAESVLDDLSHKLGGLYEDEHVAKYQ